MKIYNIVADANVSLFSRAGNMCYGNQFYSLKTPKNTVLSQAKIFLFPGHKFFFRNIGFPV